MFIRSIRVSTVFWALATVMSVAGGIILFGLIMEWFEPNPSTAFAVIAASISVFMIAIAYLKRFLDRNGEIRQMNKWLSVRRLFFVFVFGLVAASAFVFIGYFLVQ